MATLTLVIVFGLVLLIGCVSATINVSSGTGTHDVGPEKSSSLETSNDSNESTDSINELSSKISGIDKSQNEIKRDLHKTSKTAQEMQKRDEALDRLNPALPKEQRQKLYKD